MNTRLRIYRQIAGLSQAQLAEAVDCSEITIWRLEQVPAKTDPPMSLAHRLADYFRVDLSDIFPQPSVGAPAPADTPRPPADARPPGTSWAGGEVDLGRPGVPGRGDSF